MPKYLIVYYSRSGHTEEVARVLAAKLGADVEAIRDNRPRKGVWRYLRSVFESLSGRLPRVEPPQADLSAYDVVVLGCPVWASRPATPMRAFLAANAQSLKAVACFVTLGGAGARKTLARLAHAAGRPAVATLAVTESHLRSGKWQADGDRFVRKIVAAAERLHA
jgi:flavodoxin